MTSLLRGLARLDAAQVGVALRAVVGLPLLHLVLHVRGIAAVRRLATLRLRRPMTAVVGDPHAEATRLAWPLVRVATHLRLDRRGCVARSVLLWRLLVTRGIPATVRIGGVMTPTGFDAHAWVEVDDRPVGDAADVIDRYPPFDGPPLLVA